MAWVRGGDTSATYPPVMRVMGLSGADERTVNELMGFVVRLAWMSAAHTTDYVVDAGTLWTIGGAGTERLLRFSKRLKLLTELRVDGEKFYKIIEDPDFLHLRLRAELEWEAQQRRDGKNEALTVPIRLRDGDSCRYCGRMVMWRGRISTRSGTFDHVRPGQAATVDTMVVACRGCNSGLRDVEGREHEQLKPAPIEPFYSDFTADWLTEHGHPVAATQRPDIQPDHATRATRKKNTRQRPDSQSDTAPQRPDDQSDHADRSDPAPAGHRAPPDDETAINASSELIRQAIGTGLDGSGRDGSGTPPPLGGVSQRNTAGTRQRKRSRRGRQPEARS